MGLYTERHGMRAPIAKTSTITVEMYSMLLDCCEKYYDNIAWKFPDQCTDGYGCCGINHQQFYTHMKFDIPTLFRDENNRITKPNKGFYDEDDYDQYALLDLIEFIGQNCRDITIGGFHSYMGHHHIDLKDTDNVFKDFQKDINAIFEKVGLLYKLISEKIVEREVENDVIFVEAAQMDLETVDVGTRKLLEDAIVLFRHPHPQDQRKAVEKIWDALESLKTHFPGIEDKHFDNKLAKVLANGESGYESLFKKELSELGNIGNNYSIRHFNDKQIATTDQRHYDYFFNRCLSFVALAIKYLDSGVF